MVSVSSDDRDQDWLAGARRADQALSQDQELADTSDERDRSPGGACRQTLDEETGEPGVEPFGLHIPPLPVGDSGLGERVGGLTGKHLAGISGRLQSGRRVHDGSRDEKLAGGPQTRGGLPRLYADPDFERLAESQGVALTTQPAADRKAGPHGAERVILANSGEPEDRHHGVADELLRAAPKRQ